MEKTTKKVSKMNKGELAVKIMAFSLTILMVLSVCATLIYYIVNK